MQYSTGMRKGHRFANPVDDAKALRNAADARYMPVQPLTFDVLHRVEDAAIRQTSHIVHRHDARMLELGKDARFLFSGDVENFKRHAPLELSVQCQPHYAHSAVRDAFQQTVLRTCEVRQIRRPVAIVESSCRKSSSSH